MLKRAIFIVEEELSIEKYGGRRMQAQPPTGLQIHT
jgi:hypothetical protein